MDESTSYKKYCILNSKTIARLEILMAVATNIHLMRYDTAQHDSTKYVLLTQQNTDTIQYAAHKSQVVMSYLQGTSTLVQISSDCYINIFALKKLMSVQV
jgi:hypothetical protein